MKSIVTRALLALGATLAMGALASASASAALPEFTPVKTSFTVRGATGLFRTPLLYNWDYARVKGSGSILGANEVKMTLTFEEVSGLCTGSQTTSTLTGHLGYINKTNKEVGLLLEAKTPPVLKCLSSLYGEMQFLGSWIGHMEPVNTKVATLQLVYHASGTTQLPEDFEGEFLTKHHLTDRYSGGAGGEANIAQEGVLELENFRLGTEATTETVVG